MLPDVSGDDVERFLVENHMTQFNEKPTAVPTDSACTDEQHAAMARGSAPLEFRSPGSEFSRFVPVVLAKKAFPAVQGRLFCWCDSLLSS